MKKGDFILIFLILLIVIVFFIARAFEKDSLEKYVEIRTDGNLVKKIKLTKDLNLIFDVKSIEGSLKLKISSGKVYVEDSTCRDKICEKTGKISKEGESIICLPNRISISIVGVNSEFDTITY